MSDPAISVVMSVHNGAAHLEESVKSMLDQSFTDFEFLIVNDGSRDNTVHIIQSFKDPRIRQINNWRQMGLATSLNKAIKEAKGKYIARADADDLYPQDRLQKQFDLMEAKPEIGVLGGWLKDMASNAIWKTPYAHEEIGPAMLQAPALPHPAAMIRRELMDGLKIYYDEKMAYAQDYELWTRMYAHTRMANLQEVMVFYRKHAGQVSQKEASGQNAAADRIRLQQFRKLIPEAKEDLIKLHLRLIKNVLDTGDVESGIVKDWYDVMIAANDEKLLFDAFSYLRRIRYIYVHSLLAYFKAHKGSKKGLQLYFELVAHSHGRWKALKSLRYYVSQ